MNATTSSTPDAAAGNAILYKTIGISLAIASGVFIGSSFVFKKKGLLDSNKVVGSVAGESHEYLKNPLWWTGMSLMIIGEICNFVAYAFTQAILVTPLGALSVVISAVLSSIFLNERLNFQGKVGCGLCIIGATLIVLHAPEQKMSESSIAGFETLAKAPGFLTFAILDIVLSLVLIFYVGPRWGKTNIFVYIVVCSLIGGLSVVSTQGLGSAIVNAIATRNWEEFMHPSLYVLLAFVVVTLLTEINYLNKALNLFNTALVTPIYYVIFTSMTIISSAILFQGFEASTQDIITLILGFLVICAGILLLQTSRSNDPTMLAEVEKAITRPDANEEEEKSRMLDPSIMELRANPFGSIRRFSRYERDPPPPPRPERSNSGVLHMGGMHFRRRSMLEAVSESDDLESGTRDSPTSIPSRSPKRFSAANRSATIAVGGGRDGVRMYHLRDRSSSGMQKTDPSDGDSSSGGDLTSVRSPTSLFSTVSSDANIDSPTSVQRTRTVKFNSIPEGDAASGPLEDQFNSIQPETPLLPPPPPPAPSHPSIPSYFPENTPSGSAPSSVQTIPIAPIAMEPGPPAPSSPTSSPRSNITSYFSSFLGSRSSPSANTSPPPIPPPHSPTPTSQHSRAGSNSSTPSLHSHRPPVGALDQLRMGIGREDDGDRKRLVSDSLGSSEDEIGPGPETPKTSDTKSTLV